MNMGKQSVIFGAILVAIAAFTYVLSGASSATALIPALFGLPLIGLGVWAMRGNPKTPMHIAAVIGLIGALAPLSRVIPALAGGAELNLALASNVAMLVVCGAFFALCVKSFVDARRTRPT